MSFERDGFCVLRGWLPAAAVDALRGDLRRARAQLKITDAALEAADLNVDFMGRAFGGRLGAASPARREAWAYATARRAATGGGGDGAAAAERAVLGQLAAAAAEHAGYGSVYLLSEVFVVKPAGSRTEFAWHRDDANQLAKLGGEAAPDRFCSTWAPLDACGAADGGLVLRSKETGEDVRASCAPGDVVVFDRDTWHASGANADPNDRCVHYAQYSPRPVEWTPPDDGAKRRRVAPTPLWFAVAASPTREALEATLDRANAAPPGHRVVRGACAAARFPPDELPEVSCRVFQSPKGAFCLDGTKHPDALLTQSMARDDTLAALLRGAGVCGEGDAAAGGAGEGDAAAGAVAEYAVLDDLDDARWAALGLPACPLEPARRRRSRQLFVSRGATTTQVHRDAYDNVYVCLRGERTWRLAHADHGPYVERSPGSVSAAADGALRRRVAFGEVALAPGDALFVPAGTWHAVAAADDGGLSAAAAWYLDDGD